MPRPVKRRTKPQSAKEVEPNGEVNIQAAADQILNKLDFHFHCEKDPDSSISPSECTELLKALNDMQKKLAVLKQDARVLEDKCVRGIASREQKVGGSTSPASYIEMKVQLLLSYLISLTYYLLLKVKGVPVRDHPVVPRLLWIRTLIEKLKPVDQRLQYQMNKLLQWNDAKKAEEVAAGLEDAHALRPGQLVTTVQDDGEEAEASEVEAQPEDGHLGAYKPPKIAQVEYTGDHISMQERAQKELDRKKARLERSEFMRSLREESTDAPKEIVAEERSARAEKAARMMREQQEFEEDTMTRVKVKKAELRRQKQALREGRATSGGAVSLFDVASDFGQIMRGASSGKGGKGKGRRGGVLQEYEDAKQKVHGLRESVASAMDGARGRKRSSGGQMKGKRKR